jgi:hypothetical protein
MGQGEEGGRRRKKEEEGGRRRTKEEEGGRRRVTIMFVKIAFKRE